jgi:hypothetical protein
MMKNLLVMVRWSIVLSFFASCSPVAMVKPLEKGKWAATANVGGPLIGFGNSTIPVPFTAVGAAFGFSEKSTGIAKLHTTSALFGVAHVDVGWLHLWREANGWKPGFSTLPQATFMIDRWEGNARFYPSLDVNAFWNMHSRGDFLYAGLTSWFDLQSKGTLQRDQPQHWIPALNVGYTITKTVWNTSFEMKYLAPGTSNQNLTVDYQSPFKKGAVGIYVSFLRKF